MHIYKLSGRNVEVTDAMRDYVEEKLTRLDRFNDQITDARVTLTVRDVRDAGRRNRVEVQLNVPSGIIRAEEHHSDMYAAIDSLAVEECVRLTLEVLELGVEDRDNATGNVGPRGSGHEHLRLRWHRSGCACVTLSSKMVNNDANGILVTTAEPCQGKRGFGESPWTTASPVPSPPSTP